MSLELSDAAPTEGGMVTASGSGAEPGETIVFTLHSKAYALGTTAADSSGAFSKSLTLPKGATGAHEISAMGRESGLSDTIEIDITSAAGTSSSTGGGLSSTGVAVVGIGAIGLVLIVGGGLVLLAGSRRKVHA